MKHSNRHAAAIESRRRGGGAHRRNGAERGQAVLEFALCLPLLLLILTGIFTFGFALNNYLTLTDATSVGARYLAISRGQTTDPCATAASAVTGAAPLLNKTSVSMTIILNGNSYSGTTCSSGSTSSGAAGNLVQGTVAQVLATYPCSLSVYGYNIVPSCKLTAKIAEIVQ